MKIHVGDIISANVTKVASYGIEIEYKKMRGMIQILELSWDVYELQERLDQFCQVGGSIVVKVLSITEQLFYASLKQVALELDPWVEANVVVLEKAYPAEVLRVTDYGGVLRMPNKCIAVLPHSVLERGFELTVGQLVFVQVTDVDAIRKRVLVSLADKENGSQPN